MSEIKVYTDEDMDIAVSMGLRLRGISASTTLDQNQCASSDEKQIEYAASLGAVMLTHNVQDFPRSYNELGSDHAILMNYKGNGSLSHAFSTLRGSILSVKSLL